MRVSTLIFSPVVMKSGTWIWWPVSSVAGLVPPVERSPWTPGSVSWTTSSTAAKQLDEEHLALVLRDGGGEALDQEVGGVTDGLAVDHELVVRLHVHEDEVLAVHVRELHVALVDRGRLDLDSRR